MIGKVDDVCWKRDRLCLVGAKLVGSQPAGRRIAIVGGEWEQHGERVCEVIGELAPGVLVRSLAKLGPASCKPVYQGKELPSQHLHNGT